MRRALLLFFSPVGVDSAAPARGEYYDEDNKDHHDNDDGVATEACCEQIIRFNSVPINRCALGIEAVVACSYCAINNMI